MPTKLKQSPMKVPKRVLLIDEQVRPDEDLYEISILLKDVLGALAKVISAIAEQGVNIRSGGLFAPSKFKHICVCTGFIDLSNAKCNIKQLVKLLKEIDVVTDVRAVKPKPIPVDEIHFPLVITNDQRGIVLALEVFSDVQRGLELIFSRSVAQAIFYHASINCGIQDCERLAKKYGLQGLELLEAVLKLKQAEGWGIFQTRKFNPAPQQGEIVVEEGFEAIRHGRSSNPVCYFIKGYLTGAINTVFSIDISLTEKTCIAMGAKECVFELVSRSESEDKKIANKIKTSTS